MIFLAPPRMDIWDILYRSRESPWTPTRSRLWRLGRGRVQYVPSGDFWASPDIIVSLSLSYGVVAGPLTALLKREAFSWSDEAERAFLDLKRALVTTPPLAAAEFLAPICY